MSYTHRDAVRGYFGSPYPVLQAIADQPLALHGTDYIPFFGSAVDSDSVRVKGRRSVSPERFVGKLAGLAVVFSPGPIDEQRLLVASDSSLGSIYEPSRDYIIDAPNGRLSAVPGGALAENAPVAVWYFPWRIFQPGVDFALDAPHGKLRRLADGDIGDGESVLLDYRPIHAGLIDDLIESAVSEANACIELAVDPAREFGANPVLHAAATHSALALVCRAAATRELSSTRSSAGAPTAWLTLAREFAARSDDLLRAFRRPSPEPAKPKLR